MRDATESVFMRTYADGFHEILKRGIINAPATLARCSLYPPEDERVPKALHQVYAPKDARKPSFDMVCCINSALVDLLTTLNDTDMTRGAFIDQNLMVVITEDVDVTFLNHADLTDKDGKSIRRQYNMYHRNLDVCRTISSISQNEATGDELIANKPDQPENNEDNKRKVMGSVAAKLMTELSVRAPHVIVANEVFCRVCARNKELWPFFLTGCANCPKCKRNMPVYVEPLSGYGFTPGVRKDLERWAKRFNTEPPPMNMTEFEKYMVEFKINFKEMARQATHEQTRTQSIAGALRQAEEAATHHLFRTCWRVVGNSKVNRVKPHVPLDIDAFIETGANPHVGTPKRVREDPGFQPVQWHWDLDFRRRLRSTDEELQAGWPTFDESVSASRLC